MNRPTVSTPSTKTSETAIYGLRPGWKGPNAFGGFVFPELPAAVSELDTLPSQAVQDELATASADRYVLLDYRRVQMIIREQAETLGERF